LIDYLLIMLPVQIVLLGIMESDPNQVDFLFRLLFAIYGVLMIEYNSGATVGKHFGKLIVVDRSGTKAAMLYVGLRELVKSMYLIPVIGWIAGGISVIMILTSGTSLHDLAGGTKVILQQHHQELEEDA